MRTTIALVLCLLAHNALAQRAPDCSTGGAPITTTDELPWPDRPWRIEVLSNDYDLEGDPLHVAGSVSVPPNVGTAVITADQQAIMFTPAATRPATDVTFSYTAADTARSAQGTVRLLVSTPMPQASLSFSYNCNNLNCYFKAEPQNIDGIRAYAWQFPSQPSCSKPEWRGDTYYCAFGAAGNYGVTLTAMRYNGQPHVFTKTVSATLNDGVPRWSLQFAAPDRPSVSESLSTSIYIEFSPWDSCSTCTHKVDFGDGSIVNVSPNSSSLGWTGGTAGHLYKNAGVYDVKLIVEGGTTPKTFTKTIDVRNKPPELRDFEAYHPYHGLLGNVLVSMDPWDELEPNDPFTDVPFKVDLTLGDGTFVTLDGNWGYTKYEYTYKRPGTYKVVARMTDPGGVIGTATADLVIDNVPPVPKFTFDCDPGTRRCTFDGSPSSDEGGTVANYQWWLESNAGRWGFSSSTVDTIVSSNANDWTMTLTTTDNQGATATLSKAVTFPSYASGRLEYYAVGPIRVIETRSSGVRVPGGTSKVIDLAACCGINIPGNAAAAVTFEMADPLAGSEIRVAPGTTTDWAPITRFDPTSATIASNAVITMRDSKFTVAIADTGADAHLYIDLVGVFAPSTFTPPAGWIGPNRYVPVAPCRIIDSRSTPPALTSTADRKLAVRGRCGIGDDAVAMTGQIVAINPVATFPPWISVFASNRADANGTSNINSKQGYNRANGIWPALGRQSADDLTLHINNGSSDFIVDATGYFVPRASGGLQYVAVEPCKMADPQRLTSGDQVSVKAAGNCGVPRGAAAAVITHRTSAPFHTGNVRFYAADQTPPITSNGNFKNDSVNGYPVATSVVQLAPELDADVAVQGQFTTTLPPYFCCDSSLRVETWLWGYFIADDQPRAAAVTEVQK